MTYFSCLPDVRRRLWYAGIFGKRRDQFLHTSTKDTIVKGSSKEHSGWRLSPRQPTHQITVFTVVPLFILANDWDFRKGCIDTENDKIISKIG